jgi:hypothetical protein
LRDGQIIDSTSEGEGSSVGVMGASNTVPKARQD